MIFYFKFYRDFLSILDLSSQTRCQATYAEEKHTS